MSPWGPDALAQSDALHGRVRSFIDGSRKDGFDELALAIGQFQREHVDSVARLHRARLGSRAATTVDEIAALPTDVFRLRRVAAHPPELDVRTFRTSGTTSGARGAHAFRSLATYEAAAMAHASATLLESTTARHALVFAPTATTAPDSSLSFMIDLFVERRAMSAEHLVDPARGLDLDRARAALGRAGEMSVPSLVMGTAFAYVHLADGLGGATCPLPAGSRLMLTGGFKGKSREVSEETLRAALGRIFGLPAAALVGEYGMTELSSQLYEVARAPGRPRFRPPPWLRVDAADPLTLAILPRGEEGIARFIDLANVDSSVAVQTQDRVRVDEQGDVELFGRLPGATPRGCSLAIEEVMSS